MHRNLPALAAVIALATLSSSCRRDATHQGGCLTGEEGCSLPTPCAQLEFACPSADALEVRRIGEGEPRPTTGWGALAAKDDVVLSNGKVRFAVAAIGHQMHLAPNGGTIIDLQTVGAQNDVINEIYTAAGLLPEDAVRYTNLKIIDERPNRVAVQVDGALDGRPGVRIHTLYELRPCEPGVRVRSELINETPDTHMLFLEDAYFWGNHTGPWPFSPTPGGGFVHPPVKLTALNAAYRSFPYFAATLQGATPDGSPNAVYATVACNEKMMEGFHSIAVSAGGGPRQVIAPRDYTVFERFIAAVPGNDVADGVDLALALRQQLHDEAFITLTGQIDAPVGTVGDARVASVLISEGQAGQPAEERTPLTQVLPDSSGRFSARVPAGKAYLLEVLSHGRVVVERELPSTSADTDTGVYTLPGTTPVTLSVTNNGGAATYAEIFILPADAEAEEASSGDFHGAWEECAPYLGSEGAPNPACNRVLVRPGTPITLDIPFGRYHLYAFKGPFWSIDFQPLTLDSTAPVALALDIRNLGVEPPGTLSADMHIHGAASHDSYMPDEERAVSFAAADIDVAIATDHDVVYDYRPTLERLGLDTTIATVIGVETTNWIPWFRIPGYQYPLTLGHTNYWPLRYDPALPRNGAPSDEYKEPGAVYDEVVERGLFTASNHMVQLNHPLSDAELGRDLGFAKALFFDATRDLPAVDDGTGNGVFIRKPNGPGKHSNDDYQAQEVMNGTVSGKLLPYREFWFYLLNQGKLRVGTANSDSHHLGDSTIGMPRTLVFDPFNPPLFTDMRSFEIESFNEALRGGTVVGTNGPVIVASVDSAPDGDDVLFSMSPVIPAADARIHLRVTAAPWVAVEEVRVVVNGKVARTISGTDLVHPADPLGNTQLQRFSGDLLLSELLAGVTGDAWIVVEAGRKLMLWGDLGGGLNNALDGLPDTTDNNGDGRVDAADVAEGQKVGPIKHPPVPTLESDPEFHFARITGGGFPYAFTNPFILDMNGNGRFDAPGITGGRAQ
ncbi:MAG: hypothetical protein M3Y59_24785 [Myxococcota bacterium]|nr:hypothetical protein [Myxococcota bacterium]